MLRKINLFIKFSISLVTAIFILFPTAAYAEEEFATYYHSAYDVQEDGTTNVTQKITLKNLTSQFYVSNFTLTIGSTTLTDIAASDSEGPMQLTVETRSDGQSNLLNRTAISVKFNQQVAGVDKEQTFTLRYKSKDFAEKLGKIWEVNLPKMPSSGNITGYDVTFSVPISFGDPTSISPNPRSQSQTYERLYFTFSKDQLERSGVSVNFGTSQIFDFNLKYDLQNDSLFPILTSVTLPPDTAYQDVVINRISPQPENVTVDTDGNYLAWYKLPRRSSYEVAVSGSVKLYIYPQSKKSQQLTAEKVMDLIKTDRYWEKDNPAITATLKEIFKDTQLSNNKEKAHLIYRYVVNTLRYSTDRLSDPDISRMGAVTALNNPELAVCMEFTDLFVALARAAGIPARELDGFAYSQNTSLRPLSLERDLLHAWAEYYDEEKGWIMIDPTWENTSGGVDYFNKFDLNHFVLAIKGASSVTPFTSDNVVVKLSDADVLGKPQLEVSINIPDSLLAGFPMPGEVIVKNLGNAAQPPLELVLNPGTIKLLGESKVYFDTIPPFGSTTYSFNLKTPIVWQSEEAVFQADLAGHKFSKTLTIQPFFLFQPIPYVFAGFIGLMVLAYGVILSVHIIKTRHNKASEAV